MKEANLSAENLFRNAIKSLINTEKEQQFVRVVSLIDLQRHMTQYRWYGKGHNVRVRGPAKVMTHLMCGTIVIAGTQLFHLLA